MPARGGGRSRFVAAVLVATAASWPLAAVAECADVTRHTSLGQQRVRDGRYDDAEREIRTAISLAEKAGNNPRHLAVALNQLGALLREQSRAREAETYHRRALTIVEQRLGPKSAELVASLEGLGQAARDLGRYADALALLRRAEGERRRKDLPDVTGLAANWNAQAGVQRAQASYAEAERLYQRVLELVEKRPGTDPARAAEVSEVRCPSLENCRADLLTAHLVGPRSVNRAPSAGTRFRKTRSSSRSSATGPARPRALRHTISTPDASRRGS